MKRLITNILLITICFAGFANDDKLIKETKELIVRSIVNREFNPIHKAETDNVLKTFNLYLYLRGNDLDADLKAKTIDTLFHRIYDNGYCIYEDSEDIQRMKSRRAISFVTIALLSDYDKAFTFTEYAINSLTEPFDQSNIDFLEHDLLGVLLVELMLHLENDDRNQNMLTRLDKYLANNKDMINVGLADDTLDLLEKIKNSL